MSCLKRIILALIIWVSLAPGVRADGLSPSRFLKAVELGDLKKAELLLTQGEDLHAQDEEGNTALILATQHNQTAMVEWLLKQGANVFLRDRDGNTALDHAAFLGRLAIARLLVADSFVDTQDAMGRTPLMEAAQGGHAQIIRLLLGFGANVQEADKDRDTALHYAANQESAQVLIEAGANLNARNFNGATPLSTAVFSEKLEVVQALLAAGADANLGDEGEETPLHKAIRKESLPITTLLLKHGAKVDAADSFGETPLEESAWLGNVSLIKALLAAGAKTDSQTLKGRSPLHSAVQSGNLDALALLMASGSNLNLKNDLGQTPLLMATLSGSLSLSTALLAAGAVVDLSDAQGLTPLHGAALMGDLSLSEMILSAGAFPSPVSKEELTPLGIALRQGAIPLAKLLKQKGATATQRELDLAIFEAVQVNHRPQIIALSFFGANLDAINAQAPEGLKSKVDPQSNFLTRPLPLAIALGRRDCAKALINLGANPDGQILGLIKCPGCTPLHLAAMEGDLELVDLLLAKKASISYTDGLGRRAWDIAVDLGKPELAAKLKGP